MTRTRAPGTCSTALDACARTDAGLSQDYRRINAGKVNNLLVKEVRNVTNVTNGKDGKDGKDGFPRVVTAESIEFSLVKHMIN